MPTGRQAEYYCSKMIKKIINYFKSDRIFFWVLIIFLIGTFLRFYRLDAFVTFLGDQGRDTLVIKRILTAEHFPAIGPVTSVGNVYLGPFYYYFIAPWLLLSSFNPIGLTIGVAFFSSLYILVNYFVIKKIFNTKVAFLSTSLIAFSFILIDFARFSWNPNLVPLFSLLTIYFFIIAFVKYEWPYFLLGGAFLAFSIQLHYLALFLGAAIFVLTLVKLWQNKKNIKKITTGIIQSGASFLLFSVPLIFFDLKHNFLNSKSFLNQLSSSGNIAGDKLSNLINTWSSIGKYSLGLEQNWMAALPMAISIIISVVVIVKSKNQIRDFFIVFLVTILGISFFGGPKYPHYFGIVYPMFYVVVTYLFSTISGKWGNILIALFILTFVSLNYQKYYFLKDGGSYQIERAKKISKTVYDNVEYDDFALTAIPEVYSDHTARYFLEIWGKKPQERDSKLRTKELFVICEEKCKPIGNPIYDIALFAPTYISGEWQIDNVKIYKLVR